MRIFSRLNIGGPARHVVLLAAGLQARNYETTLVIGHETEREGNMLDFAREHGVCCLHLPGLQREIHPLRDLQALMALVGVLRRVRPHIVHTHTAKAGLLGRVAAHLCRVPVVVHTYHGHVLAGYFGTFRNRVFRFLEARLATVTDALIAVSASVAKQLTEFGARGKSEIRVIPLGLDLGPFDTDAAPGRLRSEADFPSDAPLVGIVGRLVPVKDIGTFIGCARIISEARPEVRFSIVGDGECRDELEQAANVAGLKKRLHFHGWHADMVSVFADLDVVVNCSLNEGTPVALIEAMAARRPIVATHVGGTGDLLGEGDRGRLVPAQSAEALAAATLEVLEESGARGEARIESAHDYVMRHHSASRLVADVDALYQELSARKL